MEIKGLDKFRERLPVIRRKRIILLIFYVSLVWITLFLQYSLNTIAINTPNIGLLGIFRLFIPVLGIVLVVFVALLSIYQMWYRRDKLKEKYSRLAYRKVVFIGFIGMILMASQIMNNIISGFIWRFGMWTEYPFSIFTTPLSMYISDIGLILYLIHFLLGIFLVFIGFLVILRALETFGLDYMAVVYLYYPEESELQDHEIYSILRHPTYSGFILMFLGGTILHLTLYSILFLCVFSIGFYIHIHFVEEKELIQRFGDSYKEYRRHVPAFIVRPKNLKKFFKFLIGTN